MKARQGRGQNKCRPRMYRGYPGSHSEWGSGNHEVAFKKGQAAPISQDVKLAYEAARVIPGLVREALKAREQKVHYDQTRLICIRCEWVPRQRALLRVLEGRGYVCVDYGACEKRQVMG